MEAGNPPGESDDTDSFIARCVTAACDDSELPPFDRATAFEELGVDSVQMIEIVFAVERRLDCEFTEAQLLGLETVGDLCRLVEEKR